MASADSPPGRAAPVVADDVRRRARTVLRRLTRRYPDIRTALAYTEPWQLLVATVLSAQTTDDTVNRVTPALFAAYPSPGDLAAADVEDVERLVYSTGYYRQKARSVVTLAAALTERFGGEVPADLDALVTLPGVGRKTASVVLAEAWGKPAIAVDTHVTRVANRLGLTTARDPRRIEADLKELLPRTAWAGVSMRLIQHGRDTCTARAPRCGSCPLADVCPWPGKTS